MGYKNNIALNKENCLPVSKTAVLPIHLATFLSNEDTPSIAESMSLPNPRMLQCVGVALKRLSFFILETRTQPGKPCAVVQPSFASGPPLKGCDSCCL
jgi:hypothetical protein